MDMMMPVLFPSAPKSMPPWRQLNREAIRIRHLKDAFGCAFVSAHLLPDLSATRSSLMWADAIDFFRQFHIRTIDQFCSSPTRYMRNGTQQ